MSQTSQKAAVVNAVKEVLGTAYSSSISVNSILTKEQKKAMVDAIAKQIMDGDIAYSKDISNEAAVRKYVPGMISNHIRKAKELNGGSQYTVQSTGRGTRDPKLSALNKLLEIHTEGTDEHLKIVTAIAYRRAELVATNVQKVKAKKQLIDIDLLPDDLHDLANQL